MRNNKRRGRTKSSQVKSIEREGERLNVNLAFRRYKFFLP